MLPLGISFYTFQAVSYTVDVYRRELPPIRNYLDYMLFVTFFPQLVAGPIERAQNLIPQILEPRRMTWERWCEGSTLFLIGLFKKLAVADAVAPIADKVFDNVGSCSSSELLLGLYCFALQIYADFSGYSDMARGLARFLGFDLMVNFNQPYFSANITEFWRRWHISLSTWLRDYVYIPLGGNRHGRFATYRNLMATMLLGGFWHGASWNFVIWGGLHGLYLAVDKMLREIWQAASANVPRSAEPAGSNVQLRVSGNSEDDGSQVEPRRRLAA
ncbi:MAG: MBOAT family O-acyltransferase [Pirellulales bacterium]